MYHFSRRDALRWIGAPMMMFVCGVAAAHILRLGNFFGDFQAPAYMEDIVISEKAGAARERRDANLLFVGDSSCLMDFSARELEELMPETKPYNLGSLSTLGLAKFGEFTAAFLATHTNVRTVVLLISPTMVRSGSSPPPPPARHNSPEEEHEIEKFRHDAARTETELARLTEREAKFGKLLALPFIKTQLVARVFETPYDGEFGFTYGFASGVREHMKADYGSALDPSGASGAVKFHGIDSSIENFVSREFKPQCQEFRRALPSGVRLVVGLTPEPTSVMATNYPEIVRRTLLILKEFLRADDVLTNLRTRLPDQYFSSDTHLNPAGARQFTHALAIALEKHTRYAASKNRRRSAIASGNGPVVSSGRDQEGNW
jgi:hypothetical protein